MEKVPSPHIEIMKSYKCIFRSCISFLSIGIDEYDIVEALKSGRITKPLVAWCIGTCASQFAFEVQFGHAGALARVEMETSVAKNAALKEAGANVPQNFFEFGTLMKNVYTDLVRSGTLIPAPEVEKPKIPMGMCL